MWNMDEKSLKASTLNDGRFQFVSFTDPAEMRSLTALHTIRQHAMKEIGKKRRRAKQPLQLDIVLNMQELRNQNPLRAENSPMSWWLGAGPMDPFIKYPISLGHDECELVALIFHNKVHTQRTLRDAWFGIGLDDAATFFSVLANSALNMDSVRNGGREPKETSFSLHYQTLAIRSITSRLGKEVEPATDQVIGAVTGLVCYNFILGDFNGWSTHVNGLINMVQSRGGIDNIAGNGKLHMTISWVEIQGAFAQDIEPFFPMPLAWSEHSKPMLGSENGFLTSDLFNNWATCMPNSQEWILIYHDLFNFSQQTVFYKDSTEAVNSPFSGAWSMAMIHQLLLFRPLKNGTGHVQLIEETCRIASLLFLASIWRKLGVFPVRSAFLVSKLRLCLSLFRMDWRDLEELHLWVLYMGCLEAKGDDLKWFIQTTKSWMLHYCVRDLDELQWKVKTILWIDNLFETQAFENIRNEIDHAL